MVEKCQFCVASRAHSVRRTAGMSKTLLSAKRWRTSQPGPFSALRSKLFCGMDASSMAERKSGRMVLIASTNSIVSEAGSAHYSAAKAAASSLARSLCVDLAPHGIRVNAVAPGWIHTSMVDEFVQSATPETLRDINPLGRVGKPGEVANLIEYLALDAPDYLTGATILIDGGQTAVAPLI